MEFAEMSPCTVYFNSLFLLTLRLATSFPFYPPHRKPPPNPPVFRRPVLTFHHERIREQIKVCLFSASYTLALIMLIRLFHFPK
jgi:hypothetical protein